MENDKMFAIMQFMMIDVIQSIYKLPRKSIIRLFDVKIIQDGHTIRVMTLNSIKSIAPYLTKKILDKYESKEFKIRENSRAYKLTYIYEATILGRYASVYVVLDTALILVILKYLKRVVYKSLNKKIEWAKSRRGLDRKLIQMAENAM